MTVFQQEFCLNSAVSIMFAARHLWMNKLRRKQYDDYTVVVFFFFFHWLNGTGNASAEPEPFVTEAIAAAAAILSPPTECLGTKCKKKKKKRMKN